MQRVLDRRATLRLRFTTRLVTSSSAATVTSPTSRSVFACSLLVNIDNVTEPWRPLVEFLVASGARWGEVTALRPCDVDRAHGAVRITRAWKPIAGRLRDRPTQDPQVDPHHQRARARCSTSSTIPASSCSSTRPVDRCAPTDFTTASGALLWRVRAWNRVPRA